MCTSLRGARILVAFFVFTSFCLARHVGAQAPSQTAAVNPTAILKVKRQSHFCGGRLKWKVVCNGQEVGLVQNGTTVRFAVALNSERKNEVYIEAQPPFDRPLKSTVGQFNAEAGDVVELVCGYRNGWTENIPVILDLKPVGEVQVTVILGIHSNVSAFGTCDQLADGHAWLTVTDIASGLVTTWGLWPDVHPDVEDNKDGSDVRENVEKKYGEIEGEHSRYRVLNEYQFRCLKKSLGKRCALGLH